MLPSRNVRAPKTIERKLPVASGSHLSYRPPIPSKYSMERVKINPVNITHKIVDKNQLREVISELLILEQKIDTRNAYNGRSWIFNA